jgi:hypothetical protein
MRTSVLSDGRDTFDKDEARRLGFLQERQEWLVGDVIA